MNEFEKVEKLTQKANVTYEEAKEALDACNGDLLDAMIYLEKSGKVEAPKSESVTTRAEDNCLPCVIETANDKEGKKKCNKNWKEDFKKGLRKFWDALLNNEFFIKKDGKIVFSLPLFAALLIFLFTFHVSTIAIIVSLFFGVRYGFMGKDDLSKVNEAIDKVGAVAESVTEKVKEEFSNKKEN